VQPERRREKPLLKKTLFKKFYTDYEHFKKDFYISFKHRVRGDKGGLEHYRCTSPNSQNHRGVNSGVIMGMEEEEGTYEKSPTPPPILTKITMLGAIMKFLPGLWTTNALMIF
jgi:hypothetical protein